MLTQTGQWFWRDNELSLVEFRKLPQHKKDDYVEFLLSLDKDKWSSNDKYVLLQQGIKTDNNKNKFLEL